VDQYTTYREDDRGEWLEAKGEYEARILARLGEIGELLDRVYGDVELLRAHPVDGAERRDMAERWKDDVGFLVTLLIFRTHTPAIRERLEALWGKLLSIQVFDPAAPYDPVFNDPYLGPPETDEAHPAALLDVGIDPDAEEA
jgi:hypothetical protein